MNTTAIIPAYNEENNIGYVLNAVMKAKQSSGHTNRCFGRQRRFY